jgi:transcriptional regulator with XRE-family HTH domain
VTLKELRDKNAYTQTEVAAFCQVTAQTVSAWERGEATPRPPQIRRLAEFYKISIEEIREAIKGSGGSP